MDFVKKISTLDHIATPSVSQLKFCVWNVQGLASKRHNKLNDPEFLNIINSYDIILCTETWTNNGTDIDINGYKNISLHRARRPRSKRDSGGIIIYYRQYLEPYIRLCKKVEDCILWFRISHELLRCDKDILICTAYVIPSSSCRTNLSCDVFQQLTSHYYFTRR